MIALDNGDKIRGDASAATVVDYTLHGIDNNAIKQMADGQLAAAIGDLYTADSTDVVSSIILVNTDSSARTVNLYITPSGGAARRLIPKNMSLGISYCLITDGKTVNVYDASGNLQQTVTIVAHTLGGSSHDADTLSNLNSKISDATLVDTDSIILKALLTTQNDIITRNGSTPIRLNIGASRFVARLAAGNLVAATVAEILTLLGVEAGATADLTGDEIVTLLEALAGAARLSHTSISDVGTSDHHTKYADAEAVSAVEAAGLTFAENKGIILDAALSVDGKYSGFIEEGTAGAVLAFGDLVYQVASDAQWELTNATTAATSDGKLGICILAAGGGAGNPTTILLWGKVRADTAFPALSVRRPVYISAADAGDITTTAPTGTTNFVVRIVGYANTADELFFCPDNTYIKLA